MPRVSHYFRFSGSATFVVEGDQENWEAFEKEIILGFQQILNRYTDGAIFLSRAAQTILKEAEGEEA